MKSVINLLYSWICFVFFTILTIIGGIISLLSLIFNPGGDISFYTMKGWAKIILWFCRIKVTVWGLENINKEITQIFASNHLSHLDILLLNPLLSIRSHQLKLRSLPKGLSTVRLHQLDLLFVHFQQNSMWLWYWKLTGSIICFLKAFSCVYCFILFGINITIINIQC